MKHTERIDFILDKANLHGQDWKPASELTELYPLFGELSGQLSR